MFFFFKCWKKRKTYCHKFVAKMLFYLIHCNNACLLNTTMKYWNTFTSFILSPKLSHTYNLLALSPCKDYSHQSPLPLTSQSLYFCNNHLIFLYNCIKFTFTLCQQPDSNSWISCVSNSDSIIFCVADSNSDSDAQPLHYIFLLLRLSTFLLTPTPWFLVYPNQTPAAPHSFWLWLRLQRHSPAI